MHRTVVLTTFVLLLLVVAGVTAAQESGIVVAASNSDASPGSTTLERTSFEATVPVDSETSAPSDVSSKPKDGEDTSEPTGVIELTVGETEEPTVSAEVEETRAPGSNHAGKPENGDKRIGKPKHTGKSRGGGHRSDGKPEERGNEEEHGRGGGQQKVTLCHKDKKTLTVGTPAQAAQLRHGDSLGACR